MEWPYRLQFYGCFSNDACIRTQAGQERRVPNCNYLRDIPKTRIITHDPYRIDTKQPKFDYEIDLGAERFIGAERGTEKIAVEVKSFVRTSIAYEFHAALGQYITYRIALQFQEPDRTVVLAMPAFAYDKLSDGLQLIIDQTGLDVLCFDTESQTIKSWKR